METFTLSWKELHCPGLVKAALSGHVTNDTWPPLCTVPSGRSAASSAGSKLGGLRPCVTAAGAGPRRGVRDGVRRQIARLMTTGYAGFNDSPRDG